MTNNSTEEFLWEENVSTEPQKNAENNNEFVHCDTTTETKNDLMQKDSKDITKPKSGIYKIVNNIDGKYYVGSTNNFDKRWNTHKRLLRSNSHHNNKLQCAWNKYGEDYFEYVIIEQITDSSKILDVEQQYLDECRKNVDSNYNLSYDAHAPWRDRKLTNAHRKNVSRALKGKPKSKEHNRKVGLANLNNRRCGYHNADKSVLSFKNTITGETFTGIRADFYNKYNLNPKFVYRLVKNQRKSFHGWVLVKDIPQPHSMN